MTRKEEKTDKEKQATTFLSDKSIKFLRTYLSGNDLFRRNNNFFFGTDFKAIKAEVIGK
ncbi:MAG: hypothetical protein NY202_01215 [Mollicutes bacterium UO1]